MKRLWLCWKAAPFKINGNQTLLGWTTCFNIALGKVKCLPFIHGPSHTGFLFRSFCMSPSGVTHFQSAGQVHKHSRSNKSISWREIQDYNFEGHNSFQATVQQTLPTVKMSGSYLRSSLRRAVIGHEHPLLAQGPGPDLHGEPSQFLVLIPLWLPLISC